MLELIIERRANVASADDFLHSSDGMMRLDAICMNLIAIREDIPLMLPVINKILKDLEKQIV